MTGGRPIGEDDLQALVDERLPAERRPSVELYLAANPAAAARVEAHRVQRDALRARLRWKAEEPIPTRLRVGNIVADRRRSAWRWSGAAAAALVWLGAGGAIGWSVRPWLGPDRIIASLPSPTPVVNDAIAAHRTYVVEVAHPTEVGAAQEAHLVQWLSKRLGRPLTAPDLTGLGFRLMGGRLLPAANVAAAQFMYDDARGVRLTLYVRADEHGETAFRFAHQGEVSAFYWVDSGLGYAVSGALDRERLSQVSEAVYRQFEAAAAHRSKAPL